MLAENFGISRVLATIKTWYQFNSICFQVEVPLNGTNDHTFIIFLSAYIFRQQLLMNQNRGVLISV